jgi:hypothetical protein
VKGFTGSVARSSRLSRSSDRPVDLDEVQELLRANAVVGVTGTFDQDTKKMTVIGIQCALYDSTVEEDRVARAAGVSAQCSSG